MSADALDHRLISADELLRMPRGNSRRFLVRGRLIEQPPRGALAGRAGASLVMSLATYEEDSGLGLAFPSGTGFQIESDPDTVLAPAAAFVKMDEKDLSEGYHLGPPALAAEIISLDEPWFVPFAVDEWLKAACPCVIVIDPSPETVTVYRSATEVRSLAGDDVLEVEDVLPGWRLPLRELFDRETY